MSALSHDVLHPVRIDTTSEQVEVCREYARKVMDAKPPREDADRDSDSKAS